MKKVLLLSLILIACGSEVRKNPICNARRGTSSPQLDEGSASPEDSTTLESQDSGAPETAEGSVSPIGESSNSPDVICEDAGAIVGHCLTHMNTLCIAYSSDHEAECHKTGQHTGWFPGDCGNDESSDLSRSIGGCMDSCGQVSWMYRLGGLPPTEQASEDLKRSCEDAGRTYVPVPYNSL